MSTRASAAAALAALALAAAPGPARAEAGSIEDVLKTLAQYGIIDKDLAAAGPVVQCVIDGKSVEACVQPLASDKANQLLKSDSKIILAVELVTAANDGDWVKLLELGGTKVLKAVVCDLGPTVLGAGAVVPQPVKDVVCSGTFDLLLDLAETVVVEAVDAIADEAYWRLVTVVGPSIACKILPDDVPVRDVACGVLGEIWEGIEQTAGAVVTAVGDVGKAFSEGMEDTFDFLDDLLGTGPPKQGTGQWYANSALPYYMNGVHRVLGNGPANILSSPASVYDRCMEYFDEAEVCAPMRDRFASDVGAYAQALTTWRGSYFASQLRPALPYYYVKWTQAGKPAALPNVYDVTSPCLKSVGAAYPYPGTQHGLPTVTSGQQMRPHTWACRGPAEQLAQTLKSNEVFLAAQIAILETKGCQIKRNGTVRFPFQCASVESFQRCETLFARTELVRPSLARIGSGAPDARLCNHVVRADQPTGPVTQGPPPLAVDLLADPPVTVLTRGQGVSAQWGGSVQLSPGQAVDTARGEGGQCRFGLALTVRNGGTAASPPFEDHLLVGEVRQASREVAAVPAGGTVPERLYFSVAPGSSVVVVRLDGAQEVTEASEQNNEYRLAVNLSGPCGGQTDSIPTTGGVARPGAVVIPQMLTIEGEALAEASKYTASGGRVTTGQASSYARQAEGAGSQLLWNGGGPGAVLDLTLDVPAAATYVVELHITGGPDYGELEVTVDGAAGPTIRGFSPRPTPSRPLQAGRFSLPAGERRITFKVVGKYATSTGYALGLDFIRLYPVGPVRQP